VLAPSFSVCISAAAATCRSTCMVALEDVEAQGATSLDFRSDTDAELNYTELAQRPAPSARRCSPCQGVAAVVARCWSQCRTSPTSRCSFIRSGEPSIKATEYQSHKVHKQRALLLGV